MAADSIKEKGGRMKIFGRLSGGALAPLTAKSVRQVKQSQERPSWWLFCVR